MRKLLRKHNPVEAAIDEANAKEDADFAEAYLATCPGWTEWVHPTTGVKYTLSLMESRNMPKDELQTCFELIEETSGDDYRGSSNGWHPSRKLKEMRSPGLRYILVKDIEGNIRAFTSLMPTFEEGQPVIYCYEVHLKPELQGSGLGRLLMRFHAVVAEQIPGLKKVMLTCFVANKRARAFYEKLGYAKDEISPETRTLRGGKEFVPDYVIMSLPVQRRSAA